MAHLAQDNSPRDERRHQIGLKTLVVSGTLLASSGLAVLAIRPDLDLAVAAAFFISPGHFAGMGPPARVFRTFEALLPLLIYFAAALAYLGGLCQVVPKHLTLRHRTMVFLTLSLALDPGLMVNAVFKTHVHRPRPVHVQDFGGESAFRPFYRWDGGCPKNCSFPSGESAAAFWTLAPAALAPPPLRLAAAGAAMFFGVATGLSRMAAGAHFLSDVLFSGLLTGLITAFVWFAMRRRRLSRPGAVSKTGLHEDLAPL